MGDNQNNNLNNDLGKNKNKLPWFWLIISLFSFLAVLALVLGYFVVLPLCEYKKGFSVIPSISANTVFLDNLEKDEVGRLLKEAPLELLDKIVCFYKETRSKFIWVIYNYSHKKEALSGQERLILNQKIIESENFARHFLGDFAISFFSFLNEQYRIPESSLLKLKNQQAISDYLEQQNKTKIGFKLKEDFGSDINVTVRKDKRNVKIDIEDFKKEEAESADEHFDLIAAFVNEFYFKNLVHHDGKEVGEEEKKVIQNLLTVFFKTSFAIKVFDDCIIRNDIIKEVLKREELESFFPESVENILFYPSFLNTNFQKDNPFDWAWGKIFLFCFFNALRVNKEGGCLVIVKTSASLSLKDSVEHGKEEIRRSYVCISTEHEEKNEENKDLSGYIRQGQNILLFSVDEKGNVAFSLDHSGYLIEFPELCNQS